MRKDSKRLPGKHHKLFAGKPLYLWTFELLFMSQNLSSKSNLPVVVSSDDLFLIGAAVGFEFFYVKRPLEKVDTGKVNEIRDAMQYMEELTGEKYDAVMDLDATNPNRDGHDLIHASELFFATPDAQVLVSVTPAHRNPYFNMVGSGLPISTTWKRSQDAPPAFDLNCNIYIYSRDFLLSKQDHQSCLDVDKSRLVLYHMAPETFCDIDDELTFQVAEFLFKRRFSL